MKTIDVEPVEMALLAQCVLTSQAMPGVAEALRFCERFSDQWDPFHLARRKLEGIGRELQTIVGELSELQRYMAACDRDAAEATHG